jgi:hypothetical protein
MKPNPLILIVAALCSLSPLSNSASAQGTAFTYQGRLNTGGSPANGTYDIAFWLCTANEGGVPLAAPVTNSAVGVTNGLFTTTVDFGNVFTGTSNWLQIAVSTNGANAFSTLSPRQQLTPVPYAVYAESANAANLVGTIPAENISGAALLDGGNVFNGNQTIQGAVGIATGQNFPAALLDVNGSGLFHGPVEITGHNTLQFGAGVPGREVNAGKIGYQTFTHDSLDIVGAGTDNNTTRKIKFWAEGGANFTGNLGIGVTNPAAALDVAGDAHITGKISSPMFRTAVDMTFLGPLEASGSFTTGGGTLLITTSGSGYSSSTNIWIGMTLILDNNTSTRYDAGLLLNNLVNTHQAFVPFTQVVSGIRAGTHTFRLVAWDSRTTTNNKDVFRVTVVELPF